MTNSIATLGIRVQSQGVKEAERDLKGLSTAGDKAERRAHSLGKAWGVALGAAVAGGAAIAVAGLKKWIANGIESEKVQAQLAARIKSTGAAAGLAVPQLNKMAAALQAATTFDDESIGRAQATLLIFTRVGAENFKRATEAVLDMSTALGTDLNSAALQVGKALNDPVQGLTALSRAGVQFSDSQKDTIKQLVETGRVADAQRIILRELETQMGGSARAARDTLGGALAALKNSFDNLLEGDAGGMRGARDAVEGFNRALNDPVLKAGLDTAFTGMINLANGAVQLIAKLGSAASALREFYGANSAKGLGNLLTRKRTLEDDIAKLERRPGLYGGANDPIAKLLGMPGDSAAKIAAKKRELDEVESLITRQYRLGDWQEGRITRKAGQGIFANVSSEAGMGPLATLDTSTGEVKAKALRSFAGAAREAADAVRDFTFEEAALERQSLANVDVQSQALVAFERIRAEMAGPLAVAQFEHIQAMQEIQRLGEQAGVGSAAIVSAKDAETAAYKRTTDAIREQQFAAGNPQAMALMDDFRRNAVDTLTDIGTGARSAKDALKEFFDSLAQNLVRASAQNLIDGLFGASGTSGSGTSGGGWLASLASALFGGGRAIGGPVSAGRIYEVNESGPEILTAGGRTFLMPHSPGQVTPVSGKQSATFVQNVTFTVEGRTSRETQAQISQTTGSAVQRAMMRNR